MLQLRLVKEEATRGTYELTCGDLKVRISVIQPPSVTDQGGAVIVQWHSRNPQQAVVRYGTDRSLPMSVSEHAFSREHRLEVNELQGRGTRYHVEIGWKDRDGAEKRVGPFCVRTLFRYPYEYRISPQNRELRHKKGDPTIVTHSTSREPGRIAEILRSFENVSPKAYLEHIIMTATGSERSVEEKLIALWKFVGTAIQHNPLYDYGGLAVSRNPLYGGEGSAESPFLETRVDEFLDVAVAFELHYARCGYINDRVLSVLCRLLGVEGEPWKPAGEHCSGRVLLDGRWKFFDLDLFKGGVVPLRDDQTLPDMDWLLRRENHYFVDTFPACVDSRGMLLSDEGRLCTGLIGGGVDPSEMGYVSALLFGGPVSFPPGVPEPLPVTRVNGGRVILEWVGSYDRSGDFRDYVVEIGTAPGASDVGSFATRDTFFEFSPGGSNRYFWRVLARDSHARGTPYENRVFYLPSAEGRFDLDALPQGPDNLSVPGWMQDEPEGLTISSLRKGSVADEFQKVEGLDDVMGNGLYAGSELFYIDYGCEGRALHLNDPTNQWLAGRPARTLWKKPFERELKPGLPWCIHLVMRTGKGHFAGTCDFPVIFCVGNANRNQGIGISVRPGPGEVAFSVRRGTVWWPFYCREPENMWHSYLIRVLPEDKVLCFLDNCEVCSLDATYLLPAEKRLSGGGERFALEARDNVLAADFLPTEIYISSNPTAELRLWMERISVYQLVPGEERPYESVEKRMGVSL